MPTTMNQPLSETYDGGYYIPEATAGTFLTPTKKFQSIKTTIKPHEETEAFAASGSNVDTVVIPERRWSDFSFDGVLSFGEVQALLDMVYPAATPATPTGGTTAKERIYIPPYNAPSAFDTYSMVLGNPGSGNARSAAYVHLSDIGYKGDLQKVSWDGVTGMGQTYTIGATIPGSPTLLPFLPVARPNINIYVSADNTFASPVQLLGVKAYAFGHKGIRVPDYDVNSSQVSFATTVDQKATATFSLTLNQDSVSKAYFNTLRNGTLVYFRFQALGGLIEAASPGPGNIFETITHDVCGMFSSIEDTVTNSVLGWTFTVTLVPDPAWGSGQYQKWDVINLVS